MNHILHIFSSEDFAYGVYCTGFVWVLFQIRAERRNKEERKNAERTFQIRLQSSHELRDEQERIKRTKRS